MKKKRTSRAPSKVRQTKTAASRSSVRSGAARKKASTRNSPTAKKKGGTKKSSAVTKAAPVRRKTAKSASTRANIVRAKPVLKKPIQKKPVPKKPVRKTPVLDEIEPDAGPLPRDAHLAIPAPLEGRGLGPEGGGQSGDTEGLSRLELADSESVEELVEEGQAYEAGIVEGVENVPDADKGGVRTRQVREDDVPEEYQDED